MEEASSRTTAVSSEARQQAELEYFRLLEGLPIGVERIDIQGTIIFSNHAHHLMHGYEPGELVGASILDLISGSDAKEYLRQYLADLARDRPSPTPWFATGQRKDGTTLDVRVDWDYEYGSRGRVNGFIAAITDITEQRRAERERDVHLQAVEEHRQHLTSLLENAVDFVLYRIAVQPAEPYSGEVVFVSDSIRDLMGVEDPSDFSSWFRSILPEDLHRVAEANRNAAATGEPFDVEMRIRHPTGGEIRWLRAVSRPVLGTDGKPRFFNGLILDITSMRRAEEERKRFELKLQQAQRLESLGVLAGGIAHDFNNLLVGMLGNADLALEALSNDAPARPLVTSLVTVSKRASELTNQLLAYSGGSALIVRPLDVNQLIEELSGLLATVVAKKVCLRLDLVRPLPPIDADSNQLRQVLMNLITNASDAIHDREGEIVVRTSLIEVGPRLLRESTLLGVLEEGPHLMIEVSDTGCGMTPATVDRIFDPFFSTKAGGRGLGLAAALGVVRSHRGAVEVRTVPERGTTFALFFPLSKAAVASEPVEVAKVSGTPQPGSRTVLVADDEEIVRSVVQKMLKKGGYAVLTAADGREAVDVFRRHSEEIDVVLLDMNMPQMDGVESLHLIREIRPDVRVVLSSGYDEERVAGDLASTGVAEFIQKPYRVRQLLALLEASPEGRE